MIPAGRSEVSRELSGDEIPWSRVCPLIILHGMKPSDLPAVRDRLVAQYDEALDTQVSDLFDRAGLSLARRRHMATAAQRELAAAELFWVVRAMRDWADHVADRDLQQMQWTRDVRPATSGLMVMEGDLAPVPVWRHSGLVVSAAAVTWCPSPDGLALEWWARPGPIRHVLDIPAGTPMGPLLPVDQLTMPLGPATPIRALPPIYWAPVGLVQAAWTLMAGPLADVTATPAPVHTLNSGAHTIHEAPVTIIRLRKPAPRASDEPSPRDYHHRWAVHEHERWQWCRPGRTDLRRVHVRAHTKGPTGAPWLRRPHVTVWQR